VTITLPAGCPTITADTDLRTGFQLTPKVSLDALTKGVVNYQTYTPFMTSQTFALPDVVNPDTSLTNAETVPLPDPWRIAQNLQYLAAGVIEPLIARYPGEVLVLASFINPQSVSGGSVSGGDTYSKHYTGEAVDIIITSKEANMFVVSGDILKLVKDADVVEFGLIFSSRSWLHIGINGPQQPPANPAPSTSLRVYTKDVAASESYSGLYPSRGTTVVESTVLNGSLENYPWGTFKKPPFAYL
jgi:hypothetical protein